MALKNVKPAENLKEAVERVLRDDPKTRKTEYNWLFLTKVLREMGFKIYIEFSSRMPSPETLFRERRDLMNKKNKYPDTYDLPEHVTIEKPSKKQM